MLLNNSSFSFVAGLDDFEVSFVVLMSRRFDHIWFENENSLSSFGVMMFL